MNGLVPSIILIGLLFSSCKTEIRDYRKNSPSIEPAADAEKNEVKVDPKTTTPADQTNPKCDPSQLVNGQCPTETDKKSTPPPTQTGSTTKTKQEGKRTPDGNPDLGAGSFKRPTLALTSIIIFNIPAGTIDQPWNSQREMMTIHLNQTLRVFNQDNVTHQLFLPGLSENSDPIEPGQSRDYLMTSLIEPGENPPTYDLKWGKGAQFWLRVLP